jgi:transposase
LAIFLKVLLDGSAVSTNSVARNNGVDPDCLSSNYKDHISDFAHWDQKDHCEKWLVYPENIGSHVCIDETSLSKGELYTFVSNADARTQKGALISLTAGVKSDDISETLRKIPIDQRLQVTAVSVDMANNMEKVARDNFPNASIVTDRFHVAQLVGEAVQEIRIRERWTAIEEENKAIAHSKETGTACEMPTYANGDSTKQLLARGRHLLFKPQSKWGSSQKKRGEILFAEFPHIESAYRLSMALRNIYETAKTRGQAEQLFDRWHELVVRKIQEDEEEIKGAVRTPTVKKTYSSFRTVSKSIQAHKDTILNFFPKRITNAMAECFNSKVKAFRAMFRGVKDLSFFLYRVSMIFG